MHGNRSRQSTWPAQLECKDRVLQSKCGGNCYGVRDIDSYVQFELKYCAIMTARCDQTNSGEPRHGEAGKVGERDRDIC